jgi:antibiotic biosynthesis monooxygenase (ABM) superfamily enzyme
MNEPIHIAITRRVKRGREREFERELLVFAQRSLAEPGARGVNCIFPVPGSGSNEYGVLRTFASLPNRDAFYQSGLYREWLASIESLVEGEPRCREVHGLEAWFRSPGLAEPPVWKMAIATYLGVVPVIMFLSLTLGHWIQSWNFVLNNIVFNAFVVVLLTWVVMPLITRTLHGWLHPK